MPSPAAAETIDLLCDMVVRGRLWGAERIHGELLKVGIKVSKPTIQLLRGARSCRGGGQSWVTEVRVFSTASRWYAGLRRIPPRAA